MPHRGDLPKQSAEIHNRTQIKNIRFVSCPLGYPLSPEKKFSYGTFTSSARRTLRLVCRRIKNGVFALVTHIAHILQRKFCSDLGVNIFAGLGDDFTDGFGGINHIIVCVRSHRNFESGNSIFFEGSTVRAIKALVWCTHSEAKERHWHAEIYGIILAADAIARYRIIGRATAVDKVKCVIHGRRSAITALPSPGTLPIDKTQLIGILFWRPVF